MENTLSEDIKETVEILKKLDKKSLLLIDSGARLLMARQDMNKELVNKRLLQET